MDILAAEQDLEAKLGADITTLKIDSFPDDIDLYKLTHPKGAILIRYNSSSYSTPEPNSTKVVDQIRTLEWIITILYRNLMGHTKQSSGIYTYIENVRDSLTGYTINALVEAGIMIPIKDEFVNHEGGIWQYDYYFQHTIPEVKNYQ